MLRVTLLGMLIMLFCVYMDGEYKQEKAEVRKVIDVQIAKVKWSVSGDERLNKDELW